MATLALGLAGAAAGSAIGIGASWGYLIGSTIGTLLFPQRFPDQVVEGPRLGDLSVSGSSYGRPIPVGYGTIRMPGNMIWSSGIREVQNSQTVSAGGGKGFGSSGPSTTQVTYTYFASFAMAFAEGEAEEVTRIWANSNLIYDRTSQNASKLAGLSLRFYPGSETQLPDELIEADKGVGQVPAHRGLVYIVFEDMPLADFGNRLPNITAEIAFKATDNNSVRGSTDQTISEGGLFNSVQVPVFAIDQRRRRIYSISEGEANEGFRIWDKDTLSEIRQVLFQDTGMSGTEINITVMIGADSGYLYFRDGPGNFAPVVKMDPDTMQVIGVSDFNLGGIMYAAVEATVFTPLGEKKRLLCVHREFGLTNQIEIFDADTMIRLDGGVLSDVREIWSVCLGKSTGTEAEIWITQSYDGNNEILIHKLSVSIDVGPLGNFAMSWSFDENVAVLPPSTWDSDANSTANKPCVYDATDDSLIFVVGRDPGTTSYVFKWNLALGVVWRTISNNYEPLRYHSVSSQTRITEGEWGWVDSTSRASLIDTATGDLIVNGFVGDSLDPNYNPSGDGIYDAETQSVINMTGLGGTSLGFVQQLFLNRAIGLGADLDAIVDDISRRVGLDAAADVNTTDLDGTIVSGYAITRQGSARSAIEPLAQAYTFDGIESDGKVKFIKRGNDPVRSIIEDELVVLDAGGEVLGEERVQEVELPERLSITFMDKDADYEQGTQSARRISMPQPTMRSMNERSIALPIAMTAGDAAQIAERVLFTAWNERVAYNWRTAWENLDLDPSDVIEITVGDTTIQTRITEAVVESDLSIAFRGLREDAVTIVSDADGQGSIGFPQKLPPAPVDTRLFLFDIPLLRDVDDVARVSNRMYFSMNGFVDGWRSGTLWDSPDNVDYTNTGRRALMGIDYGTVTNKLPDTNDPFMTDTDTVLRVHMQIGELQSVTQQQFLNNTNVAIVGNPATQNYEIILFRDAVETSVPDVYEVSHIMRARRGTDIQVGNHITGEFFFVVTRDTMFADLQDLGLLNVARYFKGVGDNSYLEAAETEVLTLNMRSLRPYAPVHLDAVEAGGDITHTWVRRTRVGGALQDGTGTVPLSEDSELYDIEILDGGGAVVRTVSNHTSTTYVYLNADIIADLGAVPAEITFRVYQISAQVGRGFVAQATITL